MSKVKGRMWSFKSKFKTLLKDNISEVFCLMFKRVRVMSVVMVRTRGC